MPRSSAIFAWALLIAFAYTGCKFELDACATDSDCEELTCPDGEVPFCDIEGDELLGNCECRSAGGTGGSGGEGGTST
ncbi:MAG: hypothetical protein AAF500_20390 [Myxococcota bacterium]